MLYEIFVHSEEITPNPEYSTQLEFWKLPAEAFSPITFSRDDSQGIRIDGKHDGFVDSSRSHGAMKTQFDRLTQNYSVLIRPELLDSFQADLKNCSEVTND